MPLVEAEAVVLRSYPLSEADLILVLYSREHGKIRVVAKRARRIKEQFAGCFTSLSHLKISFFERENRELSYLKATDLIESFFELQSDFDFQAASAYVVEVVDALLPEHEPNSRVFRLLVAMFRARKKGVLASEILPYFNLWILRLSGICPTMDRCVLCARSLTEIGGRFFYEEKKTYCSRCRTRSGHFISPEVARLLESCSVSSIEKLHESRPSPGSLVALNSLLEPMVVKAVERPMKTLGILHDVNAAGAGRGIE